MRVTTQEAKPQRLSLTSKIRKEKKLKDNPHIKVEELLREPSPKGAPQKPA
jgi:hypothetical protein